jgi:hypothetical protein
MEILKLKNESYTQIKLPSFSKFKGTKKNSPYEKFHLWVASNFGELGSNKIDVSSSWLSHIDYEKLRNLTEEWLVKSLNVPKKSVKKELAYISLAYAPAVFDENEEISEGYAYVLKDTLFKLNINN